MARYEMEYQDGTLDMGGLGRCPVIRTAYIEADDQEAAVAQFRFEHSMRPRSVKLQRQFEVQLRSKRDKRRRPVYVVTATCHITAIRHVGYQSNTWRETGWGSLNADSKRWPEAVLQVRDTTPARDLGGADRLPTMTGQQLREQQLALIAPRRRRRARR